MNKFARVFLFCLLTWAVTLVAQAQSTTANEQAAATDRKAADSETLIPSGSKVFVAPMEGVEAYLIAALAKKKTPLLVVSKESVRFRGWHAATNVECCRMPPGI
jgi:hypothetical protein